jgi:hypothetical protein
MSQPVLKSRVDDKSDDFSLYEALAINTANRWEDTRSVPESLI